MTKAERKAVAAINPNLVAAVPYGMLEPGLQAAIHLLEREARNEVSEGELADARDDQITARSCAVNVMGYRKSIDLLKEQMTRLKAGVGGDVEGKQMPLFDKSKI